VSLRRWLHQRLPLAVTWPSVSNQLGLAPSTIESITPTPLGVEVHLRVAPPLSAPRFGVASTQLAVAYGVARVRVIEDPLRADRLSLFLDERLVVGALQYPEDTRALWLPTNPSASVPIGIDDQGSAVSVTLLGHGALLGGNPGSGKSNGLRVLLAGLAR
jgi:hypothetical protein